MLVLCVCLEREVKPRQTKTDTKQTTDMKILMIDSREGEIECERECKQYFVNPVRALSGVVSVI